VREIQPLDHERSAHLFCAGREMRLIDVNDVFRGRVLSVFNVIYATAWKYTDHRR
jgi:hypothetical protein